MIKVTGLMNKVLERGNLNAALRRVVSNKGSHGVDGMKVTELRGYLSRNWARIEQEIFGGTYYPNKVRGVTIPKTSGGKRMLGIPTVLDRFIQQAIHQVLSKVYEPDFSEYSYGFRTGKNAHQALLQAQEYINDGLHDIIDLDLKSFFDVVNHDYLMSLLSKKIDDPMLLKLIRRYLQSGMLIGGVSQERTDGTPQGGPLIQIVF